MKIELVQTGSFAEATAVYEASWRESHRAVCSPNFLMSRDCAGYLRKQMDGLYLVSDPWPVGVFRLTENELSDLYIHPSHQGKGYGRACVAYAISQCAALRLTVLSSNATAVRLYEKMGFRFTGNDILLRDDLFEREMRYTEKHHG